MRCKRLLLSCLPVACVALAGVASAGAGDDEAFTGTWGWNSSLCDGGDSQRVPCTKGAAGPGSGGTCSASLALVQRGTRLCGVWDSGCSFSEGSSGTLVGEVHGARAVVRIGDDRHGEAAFPRQPFTQATLSIVGHRLHQVIDGAGAATAEVFAKDDARPARLDEQPGFVAACLAGKTYAEGAE